MNYDFTKKYAELRKEFPNIFKLSNQHIDNIQLDIDECNIKERTDRYIRIIIGATLLIIIIPPLLFSLYNIFSISGIFLEKLYNLIPKQIVEILSYSLGIGGLSFILYLFRIQLKIPLKIYKSHSSYYLNLNEKQINYRLTKFIGIYVVIGFVLIILFFNSNSVNKLLAEMLKYYVFVPICIASIYICILLIISILFKILCNYKYNHHFIPSNTRIEIVLTLLLVLDKLRKYNNGDYIDQKAIIKVANNLIRVSLLIYDYPSLLFSNNYKNRSFNDTTIGIEFKKASLKFDNLLVEFIENQETMIQKLKDEIVVYLNIFLTGKLSTLPKVEELTPLLKVKRFKKYHYVLFALYLAFPILIYLLLKVLFNISTDDYTLFFLKVLYMIWALTGFIVNPFIFEENKDSIKDILNTIFIKK